VASHSSHWSIIANCVCCAIYFLNAANYGVSIFAIDVTLVWLVAELGLSGCAPAVEYFDTDGFVGDSLIAIRRWATSTGFTNLSLF
jgi:hypothetical protein